MSTTLNIPLTVVAKVHTIEGGGYRAEVTRFPGCVAQAGSLEELEVNLIQAIEDWLGESPEKAEADARRLAEIQGSRELDDQPYPEPYEYQPPDSWSDEDE